MGRRVGASKQRSDPGPRRGRLRQGRRVSCLRDFARERGAGSRLSRATRVSASARFKVRALAGSGGVRAQLSRRPRNCGRRPGERITTCAWQCPVREQARAGRIRRSVDGAPAEALRRPESASSRTNEARPVNPCRAPRERRRRMRGSGVGRGSALR